MEIFIEQQVSNALLKAFLFGKKNIFTVEYRTRYNYRIVTQNTERKIRSFTVIIIIIN